jgi:hypothetical protein
VLCQSLHVLPIPSADPTFTNGDFAQPGAEALNPGGFATLSPQTPNVITGWVITAGDVDYVSTQEWQAPPGAAYSVDVSGESAGSIQQVGCKIFCFSDLRSHRVPNVSSLSSVFFDFRCITNILQQVGDELFAHCCGCREHHMLQQEAYGRELSREARCSDMFGCSFVKIPPLEASKQTIASFNWK